MASPGRGHGGDRKGTSGVQLEGVTRSRPGATIYQRIVSRGAAGPHLPCRLVPVNACGFEAPSARRRAGALGEPAAGLNGVNGKSHVYPTE